MLRNLHRALRRMSGPLVIAAWQVAPVAPVQDETGRTRLTFGWGSGDFLGRLYGTATDCNGRPIRGDVEEEFPASYHVGGAHLEHRFSETAHITLAVSNSSVDRGLEDGLGGGISASWEGRRFGFGLGFVHFPSETDTIPLTAYLRVGDVDRVHVQADVNPLGPVPLLTGSARLGLGVNRGRKSGFSLFAGVAECWYCDRNFDRSAGFAELGIPLGKRFDLLVFGLVGSDDTKAFGAGLRTNFQVR